MLVAYHDKREPHREKDRQRLKRERQKDRQS